jgi:hypothetical protein
MECRIPVVRATGHRNDGTGTSREARKGERESLIRCCRKSSLSPGGYGRTGRPEAPKADGFDGNGSVPVTAGMRRTRRVGQHDAGTAAR